jgi:predicted nucleic-acid-binding protein
VIGLDTNVLVRFLVDDDSEQSGRARALLQKAIDSGTPCFVSDVVLCEMVWVLERSYEIRRFEVARILGHLLRARHLTFTSLERLFAALDTYGVGDGGFADYLIREHSRAEGYEVVATFDRDLLKDDGFVEP